MELLMVLSFALWLAQCAYLGHKGWQFYSKPIPRLWWCSLTAVTLLLVNIGLIVTSLLFFVLSLYRPVSSDVLASMVKIWTMLGILHILFISFASKLMRRWSMYSRDTDPSASISLRQQYYWGILLILINALLIATMMLVAHRMSSGLEPIPPFLRWYML